MSRSAADKLALRSELENDPLELGLTTLPEDDEANANILNLVRETIQMDRESIPVSEIAKAIDRDEYNAASAADRDWIKMITSGGDVNPKAGGEVREGLMQIFGPTSETRGSLLLILTEAGNRIEQLYKAGTLEVGGQVTPSDVAQARVAT